MLADAAGITGRAAAGDHVAFVCVDGILDGRWTADAGIAATRQLARLVDRLPPGENVLGVRLFEIVGERDSLGPIVTMPISDANDPGASRTVAAIAKRDARR